MKSRRNRHKWYIDTKSCKTQVMLWDYIKSALDLKQKIEAEFAKNGNRIGRKLKQNSQKIESIFEENGKYLMITQIMGLLTDIKFNVIY